MDTRGQGIRQTGAIETTVVSSVTTIPSSISTITGSGKLISVSKRAQHCIGTWGRGDKLLPIYLSFLLIAWL